MLFRKTILILSAVAMSLATSCTTRYQDMLRERDQRIRELSGDVARLRGENEALQTRESAPQPANATATPRNETSLIDEVQKEVGSDAEVRYKGGRVSIGVDNAVTFDSGSTALKESSHKVLRSVVGVLKNKFPGRRIYIEGHTDTDPIQKTKDKYDNNRQLSSARAESVARYLISQGVPEANIAVVGYGQFDPRDPKSKARNRRVEIVVGDSM